MSKSQHPIARTIAATLERRIVDGSYVAGSALRQADIALEFGVSHIPVREALSALAQYGLVEIAPNRGATVTELSAEHCLELADMRVALEDLALRGSIDNLSRKDIAAAKKALVQGAKAKSLEDRAKWNWEFHRTLYSKAQRPFLLGQLELLWRHADRYLQFAWKHAHYESRSDAEHHEILQAVTSRDASAATTINQQHIRAAAKVTVQILRATG